MHIMMLALLAFGQASQDVEVIGRDYDKQKATEQDERHSPVLTAPKEVSAGAWFEVRISVGEKLHASLPNDHVRYLALLADGVEVSRAYLHPTMSKPEVTFSIALPDERTFDDEGNVRRRRDRIVVLRAVAAPSHSSEWWTESRIRVKAKR